MGAGLEGRQPSVSFEEVFQIIHNPAQQTRSSECSILNADAAGILIQHKSKWSSLTLCQMCGVNAIAYYSTQIFRDAGSTVQQALLFSLGAGIINWIGAIPGTLTIDKAGRRALLLTTFPLMFLCLLFTGCGFYAPSLETRSGLVGTGIYLFMVVYSPGMGPVPFTYSAEAQVSFYLSVQINHH